MSTRKIKIAFLRGKKKKKGTSEIHMAEALGYLVI